MDTATIDRHSTKRDKPGDWTWNDGIGFLPLDGREIEYGHDYFANYQRLAETTQGHTINKNRVETVYRWVKEDNRKLVDVGIGAGQFLETMSDLSQHINAPRNWILKGSDVNPEGIQWLINRDMLVPVGYHKVDVLTFWDVLEHIPRPQDIFKRFHPNWIFISMPIYHNEQHVFRSKHYKPGEHCWYFTEYGLRRFMQQNGYILVEMNALEIVQGFREDVWTFAFMHQEL